MLTWKESQKLSAEDVADYFGVDREKYNQLCEYMKTQQIKMLQFQHLEGYMHVAFIYVARLYDSNIVYTINNRDNGKAHRYTQAQAVITQINAVMKKLHPRLFDYFVEYRKNILSIIEAEKNQKKQEEEDKFQLKFFLKHRFLENSKKSPTPAVALLPYFKPVELSYQQIVTVNEAKRTYAEWGVAVNETQSDPKKTYANYRSSLAASYQTGADLSVLDCGR
jgi:hypothetical protein